MRMLNNKPTVIDLFSGAGGLSEGFIQAGFHILASVEFDIVAAKTQEFNHTRYRQYRTQVLVEDLRYPKYVVDGLLAKGIEEVDVIVGGPPCQGFSRSNSRSRNIHNPLNKLFYKFLDVVAYYQPYIFVLENVAGLTSLGKGFIVDEIIRSFEDLGYKVEKAILNAVHYGVPQYRKRIFFLGIKDHISPKFPEQRLSNLTEYVTVKDAISDLPSLSNGSRSDILPYSASTGLSNYQKSMRNNSDGTVLNNLVTKNSELVLKRYSHIPQGGNWRSIPDSLMANYKDKERCHQWIYRRLPPDVPSVAITNFRKNMLIHPFEDRGLSVREAARIQSFPDDFVFWGGIGSQQQQVANAVPPLLAKAIALSIRRTLGE